MVSSCSPDRDQRRFLPLFRVVRLLLHDLENPLAGHGAVLWVAVDRDRLFKRADIVFSMHIDASATLLSDLSYRAALPADDGAHHVAGNENSKREVGLPTRTAGNVSIL